MRYIKEILNSTKPVSKYIIGSGGRALVHDDGNETDSVQSVDTLVNSEVLGVGIDKAVSANAYALVSYDNKMARLHKFVTSIEPHDSTSRIHVTDIKQDWVLIGSKEIKQYIKNGNEAIAVNTASTRLAVMGYLGSVVLKSPRLKATPKVLTLYDALAELCLLSGINLLKYRDIHIYSEFHGTCLTIHFDGSEESRKFFNKMWFDIHTRKNC